MLREACKEEVLGKTISVEMVFVLDLVKYHLTNNNLIDLQQIKMTKKKP